MGGSRVGRWKQVEVRGEDFHFCPAWSEATKVGGACRWELRSFFHCVFNMKPHRWLDVHGQHRNFGAQRVEQFAQLVCPGLPVAWWPSRRMFDPVALPTLASSLADSADPTLTDHGEEADCSEIAIAENAARNPKCGSHRNRTQGQCFSQVVTAPWLLLFLVLALEARPSGRIAERKDRAWKLLRFLCRLATKEPCHVEVCVGLELTLKDGLVTLSPGWERSCPDLLMQVERARGSLPAALRGEATCMGAWLWAALSISRCESTTITSNIRRVGESLVSQVSLGLDAWARRQPPAPPTAILNTMDHGSNRENKSKWGPRRGPRTHQLHPALRAHLSCKAQPQRAIQHWQEDGGGRPTCKAQAAMLTQCTEYRNQVYSLFSGASVFEIILDSSRFGGPDLELGVVFAPDVGGRWTGLAAYLPPARKRELLWRSAKAGAPLSTADQEALATRGLSTRFGMRSRDFIQIVNHFLQSVGKSLYAFRAEAMPRMSPGCVRVWCEESQRWWRHSLTGDCEPELPEKYLQDMQVPMLLLTGDQESCGRRACHFLAGPSTDQGGGMNLMLDFLPGGEPFHRSWNDFQWACRKARGQFEATRIQMTFVYNFNYQPFQQAANLQKKQEIQKELQQIMPVADDAWEAMMDSITLDQRAPAATDHGAAQQAYDELFLNNRNFKVKGMFVRQANIPHNKQ